MRATPASDGGLEDVYQDWALNESNEQYWLDQLPLILYGGLEDVYQDWALKLRLCVCGGVYDYQDWALKLRMHERDLKWHDPTIAIADSRTFIYIRH